MANAVRIDLEVKIVPYKIVLELSQEEAETLYSVTGLIGGKPQSSSRKYIDNIRSALIQCNVSDTFYNNGDYKGRGLKGEITFTDIIKD